MNNKLNIIFLGMSGFPYGLAAMQRSLLLSKGLVSAGAQVTFFNRKPVLGQQYNLPKEGVVEGIQYYYTSGNSQRPKSFKARTIKRIKGFWNEIKMIWKLNRTQKIDAALVYERYIFNVMAYYALSRFLGFPLILNLVEYRSKIKTKKSLGFKINDYLFDKLAYKMADAFIPISNLLISEVLIKGKSKPYIKIPPITDFSKFNLDGKNHESYFLFCGSAGYKEVIQFILDSFEQAIIPPHIKLYLVINGTKEEMVAVQDLINGQSQKNRIILLSNLEYTELAQYYKGAMALLIPIRNNLQDSARFPHKISEYTASGIPIITTNFGEISHYFKDMENAFVAEHYTPKSFKEKLEYVALYPDIAKKIGQRSKEIGLKNFEYRQNGEKLFQFIEILNHA